MTDEINLSFADSDGDSQSFALPLKQGLFAKMKRRVLEILNKDAQEMYWTDGVNVFTLNSEDDLDEAIDYACTYGSQEETSAINIIFCLGTDDRKTGKTGEEDTLQEVSLPDTISKDMLFVMWAELKQRESAVAIREQAVSEKEKAVEESKKDTKRDETANNVVGDSTSFSSNHAAYMCHSDGYNAGFNAGFQSGMQYQAGLQRALTGATMPFGGCTAEYEAGYKAGRQQLAQFEQVPHDNKTDDEDGDDDRKTDVSDEETSSDESYVDIDDLVETNNEQDKSDLVDKMEENAGRVRSMLDGNAAEKSIGKKEVIDKPKEVADKFADEDRVIAALQALTARSDTMQKDKALRACHAMYMYVSKDRFRRQSEALQLVTKAMLENLEFASLQSTGSSILYHLIRIVDMDKNTQKEVIDTLLSGMEAHLIVGEERVVRNGLLTLCLFKIPEDILPFHRRFITLLTKILQLDNDNEQNQRMAVNFLNSMAFGLNGEKKKQMGELGTIEVILKQIRKYWKSNVCDGGMEAAWNFLWNITDLTPANCARFLACEGLILFEQCFIAFRNKNELIRIMMGVIGNVAEIKSLRKQLMTNSYIDMFAVLLADDSTDISYNSAAVFVHLVADGEDAWKGMEIDRDLVMAAIVKVCSQWQLGTPLRINYNSLRSILPLLSAYDSPASQHWVVWALANLTTTNASKYCKFVVEEGGESPIINLMHTSGVLAETKDLASKVLKNIRDWRAAGLNADILLFCNQ